jgi:hypothetical protein
MDNLQQIKIKIKIMNNIPVFEAYIDDINCGIYRISLVDLPAVESDFVYFNNQDKVMKFSIENEEQHMVTGVIMRANFNIYRYDKNYGEFYIRYSPETIKLMAEKMMCDNTFNNINIMHEDGTDVDGINLVELFIKDTEKGIDPIGFDDIENGSLFATYKVNNSIIWDEIKNGTFKGFSLEGIFDLSQAQFKKQNNNNNSFLNTMTKLFNRFLKSFVKCGSVETDKGTLYWVGEADLQIGDELFYNTENEEAVKVEDGEYTLDDGTVIVVKEGLVSEIREKDGEQEGELDMEKDKEDVECEEEIIVEDPEEIVDEPKDEGYDDLKRDIDDLRKEHDELKGIVESLKDTLNAILEKPAAEPIVEEFNKSAAKGQNGIPEFGSKAKRFK